ncbi:MAG: class II aldolase/adducin family protein [Rhodospirillaceae bacterium]|nr:class II aldolase/adducin family protein [Rhodospirillaceae bacterium]
MAKLEHLALRKEIIETCRRMNAAGINQGTSGNVSARIDRGFLITPSGIPYDEMTPEQIVEMDLDGGYRGDLLPSSEWRMHLDIMRTRPEAGAVIHTHAVHATALSTLRKGIPAFHYMIGVGGGTDIRCAEYATFGTEALSRNMLKALEGRTACLLANHGMICFAANLKKALWLATEVETLARQYWCACQAGDPVVLSEEEMRGVLARFKTYGKQAHELAEGEAPAVEAPVRRDAPARRRPARRKTARRRTATRRRAAGRRARHRPRGEAGWRPGSGRSPSSISARPTSSSTPSTRRGACWRGCRHPRRHAPGRPIRISTPPWPGPG